MDFDNVSSNIVAIIALFIAVIAAIATIISIIVAQRIFRRSFTLQTEIFMLNAYKEFVNIASDSTIDEWIQTRTKTQFLMAIDLYCKYVLNGLLDKQLSNDNQYFYKEVIKMFNDEIKANIKEYNNIADYVEKYKIEL